MFELKNEKTNYDVKELTFQMKDDGYVLSWSYHKGNGFLIVLSSARTELGFGKDAVAEINKYGKEFLEQQEYRFQGFKTFWIKESVYASQDRKFLIERSDVEAYLPAKIQIFCCEQRGEDIDVYRGRKEDALYIPLSIRAEIRYKKIWFSRKKRCFIKIQKMADYLDGLLVYQLSGQLTKFPLTNGCLGKEMIVTMSRDMSLELKVSEKYRNLYEVKKNDDKQGKK